jgi:hypothetical protein
LPVDKFPTEYNYNCFDDVIFYADSPTMDIISNVYWWYKEIVLRGFKQREHGLFIEEPEFYFGPGTILYKYLINWSIHPHCELQIPYYLVTKGAEEKKLHSIKNWREVMEITHQYHNSIPNESIKNH